MAAGPRWCESFHLQLEGHNIFYRTVITPNPLCRALAGPRDSTCLAFLPHADLALLVVHADKGVEEFTRVLHYLARHLQVPHIIPVVNQPQDDPETLELVLMELEELEGLEKVCVVENLKDQDQGLLALLETAEGTIGKEPVREEGQFYMALEQVLTF